MDAKQLEQLDAEVEREPEARSRAGMMLDLEQRDAQETHERARAEVRRRALNFGRGGSTLGRVGTQTGRMVDVMHTQRALVLRDPAVTINGGALATFDAEGVARLVAVLTEAIDLAKLNLPEHHGPIGRVPTLPVGKRPAGAVLVERGASIAIRDVSRDVRPDTDNLLVMMNANQARTLRDALSVAIGR